MKRLEVRASDLEVGDRIIAWEVDDDEVVIRFLDRWGDTVLVEGLTGIDEELRFTYDCDETVSIKRGPNP
jgi:hypothetical protein